EQQGVLAPKYKQAFFAEPRSMFELYDLQQDPDEFDNLSGDPKYADVEQQLKEVLHEWMMVYQDYLPLPIPPSR
ncbi:MAG: sulfatase/phosphatase domain-containing protein, partial [Tunicatimonas sp.]|uniref:sulfatase/phosphatase domain-containing protein n=1 Tax=Tunicatimonas sp. TaxID=1940096 RepID=UPI003C709EEC